MIPASSIDRSLQKKLNAAAAKMNDCKPEVIAMLSDEQPRKSRAVEQSYSLCVWWEGCYYCQDNRQQWDRIKCFI